MDRIEHGVVKICADGKSALCKCRSIHPLRDGKMDTTRDLEDQAGFRAHGIHLDLISPEQNSW